MPPAHVPRAFDLHASTQLLITSKDDPYLSSTNVNAQIDQAAGLDDGGHHGTVTLHSGTPRMARHDGDLQRLVEIANCRA